MLDQLELFSELDIRLKSSIKAALRYPMIVGGVMVIAGYIVLTKVIPVFTQMFTSMGAELPITTRALIFMSGFLQDYGLILFLSIAGTIFLFRTYIKTDKGAFQWDTLKLHIPIVKTLIRSGGMARFTLTLNTLVGSGIQIVDAFDITRKTIGNLVYEKVISEAREKIIQGSAIHASLENDLIPDVARNMIAIGEEAGSLNPMLTNISEFYLAELDEKLEGLAATIEPVLTVVIGVFVAGFVASIFLPMFSLYNAVQ
jgi:type IV pilus assembly protein PilC